MSVIEFEGKKPKIHPSVFLAPGSWVIGDVTLDEDVNIWTNAVVRGDDDSVVIGARTTVLENCLIEAPTGNPVEIGEDVIISHGATVHGAKIEDGCIVGIGAIVLDNAKIGAKSIIGSGALVSPRTEIPENQLVLGMPAKPVRECKEAEHSYMAKEHERTLSKAKVYKEIYKKS
ncbi:MAG: gamma carbonic anhydrase family protein [Candidatus Bathyarchaeota archaeon]|nr:gamma carbonic anhydrase family protein [Candidatus Bathyarchaeota archaeon]